MYPTASDGEDYDNVPQKKRQLGIFSVVLLIFNRVVGTGIFATPATILRSGGSVGMSFMMYVPACLEFGDDAFADWVGL